MTYVRSLRLLVPLATLALVGPAACGDTTQKQTQPPPPAPDGGTHPPPPPPSEGDGTSCTKAVDITTAVAGGGTYSGRATAKGDFQGLCASQKGSIEYLRFDAAPGNYEISLSGKHDDSALTATLDVRTDCASTATELGCDPHATSPATLVGVSKPGGVVIVLSGDWYGEGYEMRIKPATKCDNDGGCAGYYPQTVCATKSGICYAPLACAPGTADCNADPSDGCETDTTKDTANCGGCGVSCAGPNATSGTCAASSCALACETGYADCDHAPANGCETYLPGDGANCGACGNDCKHGGCAASTCTAPPDVIGTASISQNAAIGLDANNIYVGGQLGMTMAGVLSVPKSGGAATLLASDDCEIESIVVDAGTVYWAGAYCQTQDEGIKSVPAAGGATSVILNNPGTSQNPAGLISDATTLYFYDRWQSTILSVPKTGGTTTVLATAQNTNGGMQIFGLAVDATTLYYTARDYIADTTSVYTLPKSGGTPASLAALPPGSSGQLAISGTDLYVATDTSIVRVATSGGALTTITSANLGSSDPSFSLGIISLAIADGNLYWSEGAINVNGACEPVGGIWRFPLAGGAAAGLASREYPGPIAADASGVYMSATCSGAVALRAGP